MSFSLELRLADGDDAGTFESSTQRREKHAEVIERLPSDERGRLPIHCPNVTDPLR